MDWTVVNFSCALATLVESAEPGRNEELSFFWTSASLPWYDPPAAPTRKNRIARAANTHTIRGRRDGEAVRSGASSIKVIASSCVVQSTLARSGDNLDGVSPLFTPDFRHERLTLPRYG